MRVLLALPVIDECHRFSLPSIKALWIPAPQRAVYGAENYPKPAIPGSQVAIAGNAKTSASPVIISTT